MNAFSSAEFDNYGPARRSDPWTSCVAHTRGFHSELLRWEILSLLAQSGPLPDDDIVSSLGDLMRTQSGTHTRRRELVDLGLVRQHGYTKNVRNRSVIRWAITAEGQEVLLTGDPEVVSRRFTEWRDQRKATNTPLAEQRLLQQNSQLVLDLQESEQRRTQWERLVRRFAQAVRNGDGPAGMAALREADLLLDLP